MKGLPGSVKSKLLLACAGFLTAVTLLHTSLTAWLIERHGEAEAINRLSLQLMQLQDELQSARDALDAVAQEAARDEKNLSDIASVYRQALTLKRQQPAPAADDVRRKALRLQKVGSLNRLRVILASARLSSLAVYLDGELSHYVTSDEAGMSAWRAGGEPIVVGTRQHPSDAADLGTPERWPERALPVLVPRRSTDVSDATPAFEFPVDQLMVLRAIVPMQGVPGQLVFSRAFTPAFLRESADKTGVLPAVMSPDGRRRLELVSLNLPAEFLGERDDQRMSVQTASVDGTSYYQALRRWRVEGDTIVILEAALSQAGTQANVRRGIILVAAAAGAILTIGMALGYIWISWIVSPINDLTAAATSMDLDAMTLSRYLEHPVQPHTSDEIGKLTVAFNVMAARLHELIGTLEQQVRERTAQIEAANRELESFSYSVSHDLRAPLRSLDGFSRALLEDHADVLSPAGRDYLQRIRGASQRMGHLIDDLLSLAHVSRVGLLRLPVDLTALAKSVAEDLRLGEPGRSVELVVAPGLRATGDPRLLRVLFQNLLQNAWKFTGTRPVAQIECGQTTSRGEPAFFIRDNGVGFDMTYAHKLFGAFQRLHTTSEFPGTGIGLATVQRIVVRHGGRVWAESRINQGATFYFTLADEAASGV